MTSSNRRIRRFRIPKSAGFNSLILTLYSYMAPCFALSAQRTVPRSLRRCCLKISFRREADGSENGGSRIRPVGVAEEESGVARVKKKAKQQLTKSGYVGNAPANGRHFEKQKRAKSSVKSRHVNRNRMELEIESTVSSSSSNVQNVRISEWNEAVCQSVSLLSAASQFYTQCSCSCAPHCAQKLQRTQQSTDTHTQGISASHIKPITQQRE